MVEKSAVLVLVLSLVLALSFRDIMVNSSRNRAGEQQATMDEADNFDSFDNEDRQPLDDDKLDNMHEFDDDERSYEDDFEDGSFDSEVNVNMKKIPSLKMKGMAVQTLKFQFCYSCGYRNMFEQYSAMIVERYPDIKIVGENYAPVPWKIYVAQFLSTTKILIIAFIMFGQNPFEYMGMATPQLFTWATENKMYSSLMLFFISNAIETQLITSGAFEIYLNGVQIWSKLQSERMPHEKELMQMLDMNFNFDADKASGFKA